jgi:endonuclease III
MSRESNASRKDRTAAIIRLLKKHYPGARSRLDYSRDDPMQSLVATILSAQCTDERVNIVTRDLFQKYTSVADFAEVSQKQLEQDVRTCGFYRNKAKNIRRAAQKILDEHDGEVPDTMDALLDLPGVARKTANCVLSNAFGKNEGVVVDTHVKRLAGRLKLTGHDDPKKIEPDLMDLVPKKDWGLFSHLLIFHGRACCTARKPDCQACCLAEHCPSAGKV